jgi:hypothetical protein
LLSLKIANGSLDSLQGKLFPVFLLIDQERFLPERTQGMIMTARNLAKRMNNPQWSKLLELCDATEQV